MALGWLRGGLSVGAGLCRALVGEGWLGFSGAVVRGVGFPYIMYALLCFISRLSSERPFWFLFDVILLVVFTV